MIEIPRAKGYRVNTSTGGDHSKYYSVFSMVVLFLGITKCILFSSIIGKISENQKPNQFGFQFFC